MSRKAYSAVEVKNLLALNGARLVANLITEDEFTAEKKRIIRLPRVSMVDYQKHDSATCIFCEEDRVERARMDSSILTNTSSPAERVGHHRI